MHSLGLKFGLYSDSGTKTCQNRPGSLGYEFIDAATYAKWKYHHLTYRVDYLKYDNCFSDDATIKERYTTMKFALAKTDRPIYYSMCEWGKQNPATWAP